MECNEEVGVVVCIEEMIGSNVNQHFNSFDNHKPNTSATVGQ